MGPPGAHGCAGVWGLGCLFPSSEVSLAYVAGLPRLDV